MRIRYRYEVEQGPGKPPLYWTVCKKSYNAVGKETNRKFLVHIDEMNARRIAEQWNSELSPSRRYE